MSRPWSPGAATAIGSMPGTDPDETVRLVFGELAALPFLPELPGRGPGADMIGRAAGLLVDLPVEIAPSGWRFAGRPGRDLRRARDLMARDLDALEAVATAYAGPLKVQVAGPWTLAAAVELAGGHAVVSDPGAVRDLTESLAEGLRAHVADVAARVPGANVIVQVDEPSVDRVLAGRVPTPSGYGTVAAAEPAVVEHGLAKVLDVADPGARVLHSCADDVPVALFRAAGADAIAVDASRIRRSDYDALGAAIDDGMALWLGVVPARAEPAPTRAQARVVIDQLWGELGFAKAQLATSIVPTTSCGLAGASADHVRRTLTLLRELGQSLRDDQD